MKALSHLPSPTLFAWWASYDGPEVYEYLARRTRHLGYEVSQHQIRRELKQRLRHEGWLPTDRPPTLKDYQGIKAQIIASMGGDLE